MTNVSEADDEQQHDRPQQPADDVAASSVETVGGPAAARAAPCRAVGRLLQRRERRSQAAFHVVDRRR